VAGLLVRLAQLKEKARGRTGRDFPIIVIQEAGLDGFWIQRVLLSEGIESHVVDAASILTSRRRRGAKTDRIDGETLVRTLLTYNAGSRGCTPWSRRRHAKRKTAAGSAASARRSLASGGTRQPDQGLLFAQGVSDYEPLKRNRPARLEGLKAGDARPCRRT
jgi:transposase